MGPKGMDRGSPMSRFAAKRGGTDQVLDDTDLALVVIRGRLDRDDTDSWPAAG